MVIKTRKYFSFFGILAATVSRTMSSILNSISSILSIKVPQISDILRSRQLKPVKTYSTHNYKLNGETI
ncbi:MAG: hypothetical protein WC141_08735 [Arcobacteraceae bacterium]